MLPSLSGLHPHYTSGSIRCCSVHRTDSRSMDKGRSLSPSWLGDGPGVSVFNKLPQVILMWQVMQHTLRKVTQDNVREKEEEIFATCSLKVGFQLSAIVTAERPFSFNEQLSGRVGKNPKPNKTSPGLGWGWVGRKCLGRGRVKKSEKQMK